MRRLAIRVLASLVSIVVVGWGMAPVRADFDLRVIWPTTSMVNPLAGSYQFTVSDTGPGTLYAEWRGTSIPIPHQGTVTMDFAEDRLGRITIVRCREVCEWAGVSSPLLQVYRSLYLQLDDDVVQAPGPLNVLVHSSAPLQAGAPVSATWRVRESPAEGSPVIASGSATLEAGAGSFVVPASLPALAEGSYGLEVEASHDLGGGTVTSSTPVGTLTVDNTAPAVTASLRHDSVFPVVDDYWDHAFVDSTLSETSKVYLDVFGSDGSLVVTAEHVSWVPAGPFTFRWFGRVAEGDYTLVLRVQDVAGNTSRTAPMPITVSRAALKFVTWSTVVKAAPGVTRKSVGSCSRLVSPASRGWADSLGYYSRARCDGPAGSGVWTDYRIELPPAYLDRYAYVRLGLYGGPSLGSTGSLETAFRRVSDGTLARREVFSRTLGHHLGDYRRRPSDLIARSGTRRSITFRASVRDGWRYDVKTFELILSRQVLVSSSGEISIPTD